MELKLKDKQTLEDIHKTLAEVQTTNRFILRRVNHAVDSGGKIGSCCCTSVVLSEETYKNVNTRLAQLESSQNQTNDSVKLLKKQLEEIQTDVNNLQEKKLVISNQSLSDVDKRMTIAENTQQMSDTASSDIDKTTGIFATEKLKMHDNYTSGKADKSAHNEQKTKRSLEIKKPNFDRDSISAISQDMPTIIEQNQKRYHQDHKFWDFLAFQEYSEARNSDVKDIGGAHTVLCIDISLSMSRGDAWKHVTTFLNNFIGGLEEVAREHSFKDDHVALVTFGHDTRVVQRFTNDLSKIRNALGNIKLGGPSPMYGGLEMSTQAAASPEKHMDYINGIPVHTRIVLITDGEITDSCLYQGPDEADLNKLEEAKTHVLSTMQFYQSSAPIDFYCIPVGNPNMDFLELMTGVANGKVVSYVDGRQFARRPYLMTKTRLGMPFGQMGMFSQMSGQGSFDGEDYSSLSVQDKDQIEDIKKLAMDHMRNAVSVKLSSSSKTYLDIDSVDLPAVGTRVRRGPDWKWNMQDNGGPGTVIGQHENGVQLWVDWDANNATAVYRYGLGNYDLLIVDEPRNVTDGKLVVGCTVKPGKDFQYSGTKVGSKERGVAIKINQAKHTVRVKWDNKEKGKYKYSDNRHGTMEVEICSPYKDQPSHVFAPEQIPIKKAVYTNKNT